jgi:hypothetical protein
MEDSQRQADPRQPAGIRSTLSYARRSSAARLGIAKRTIKPRFWVQLPSPVASENDWGEAF